MKYLPEEKRIIIDKVLNNLDKISLKISGIIQKHIDYVIISGYVSILLGRTRTTEDVDLFIKKIDYEKFEKLAIDLEKNNFECLNTSSKKEMFNYLNSNMAVRFSLKGIPIPNFEIKFPKNELDESVFEDFIEVVLPKGSLKISSLERHIAFKKYYLGSDKDEEDAFHIEKTFKGQIDYNKVEEVKNKIMRLKKQNG